LPFSLRFFSYNSAIIFAGLVCFLDFWRFCCWIFGVIGLWNGCRWRHRRIR
jgi:hypothetical protein